MTRCAWLIATLGAVSGMTAAAFGQSTLIPSAGGGDHDQVPSTAPLTLTLQDALDRAKKNNPEYRAAVPGFAEVQGAAANKNPELRAAVSALEEARHSVAVAWYGFLPSLSLDYFYGIDANQFAVGHFDPVAGREIHNLGYAATATLQLPVWNWGANRSTVKQANPRREQAQVELSFTQRQVLSKLHTLYQEAQTAGAELDSLNQSAELAADSLRLTTLRYQAGDATVLEVVDAQNTFTQQQNAFNDGPVRFHVSLADLQTLTGNF